MEGIIKWIAGVGAVLFCAAIIAIWKLVSNKADKSYLISEIKDVNTRMDQVVLAVGLSVSKIDFNKDLGMAATRADDKRIRIEQDIGELKSDIKVVTEKVVLIDKKLDDLPVRVTSLETTRRETNK